MKKIVLMVLMIILNKFTSADDTFIANMKIGVDPYARPSEPSIPSILGPNDSTSIPISGELLSISSSSDLSIRISTDVARPSHPSKPSIFTPIEIKPIPIAILLHDLNSSSIRDYIKENRGTHNFISLSGFSLSSMFEQLDMNESNISEN